jgi:hypothetical protein
LKDHQEPYFKDANKLKEMKDRFIKYATEEQLRRNCKDKFIDFVNDASKVEAVLYPECDDFFKRVWGTKET